MFRKKFKNTYKEAHIFELNMMAVADHRRNKVSFTEIAITCMPLVIGVIILIATFVPDMQFFAECQNIQGGDLCTLSFK
jgi:hypothetical protein